VLALPSNLSLSNHRCNRLPALCELRGTHNGTGPEVDSTVKGLPSAGIHLLKTCAVFIKARQCTLPSTLLQFSLHLQVVFVESILILLAMHVFHIVCSFEPSNRKFCMYFCFLLRGTRATDLTLLDFFSPEKNKNYKVSSWVFDVLLLLLLLLMLWSSGQSFWLQIQRSRVRFPALPSFLRSRGLERVHSASWGLLRSYFNEKVAAPV
jgi:hypothetical protein